MSFVLKHPVYVVQLICIALALLTLVSVPFVMVKGQSSTLPPSVISDQLSMIHAEHTLLRAKLEEMDKSIAVLGAKQASYADVHAPERLAVLDVKMEAVDSKLNVIIGALIMVVVGLIAEFFHRVKLTREKVDLA